jgi:hypothetical protein
VASASAIFRHTSWGWSFPHSKKTAAAVDSIIVIIAERYIVKRLTAESVKSPMRRDPAHPCQIQG